MFCIRYNFGHTLNCNIYIIAIIYNKSLDYRLGYYDVDIEFVLKRYTCYV